MDEEFGGREDKEQKEEWRLSRMKHVSVCAWMIRFRNEMLCLQDLPLRLDYVSGIMCIYLWFECGSDNDLPLKQDG